MAPRTREGRLQSLFYPLSACTNLLMIVAFIAARRRVAPRPGWTWCLIGAGLLNAYWLAFFTGDDPSKIGSGMTLGVGYFCWWLSFFVIAFALWPARAGGAPVVRDAGVAR